ncbi:MAG TPA: hypothetical protein VMT09_00105 [Steroidobacteraceae bacterium]|nr:hypothetical protein [Steroidobacteraceae bacterium]
MELKITPEERAVLTDLIQRSLSEARVEVHRTENREWREQLHDETETLRALLERLRQLG